jgi:anti-sigma factor RsiW
MNCENIQARLQDFLDGKLPADEHREVKAHVDGCDECAALAALMRLDLPAEGAPDLAASVLERTSGSACSQAREILCDFTDGTLEGTDLELLRLHLDACNECTTLATALEGLGRDLPAMARLEPGAGFVEEVLAATLPRPDRWADLVSRWARGWASLIQRPRIAWEAGYVGAAAVWIVVSVFGAPFQASVPLPSSEAPAKIVDGVKTHVTQFGRRAWAATGGRGVDTWNGVQGEIHERYRRSEGALDEIRHNSERLKNALFDFDVQESGRAWSELTDDARSAWKRFASDPETTDAATE